jgi:membrane protein DedA with SNARE-associated domain
MSGHFGVASQLHFVERHGYSLLFLWVLGEQALLPLPSLPLMLAVGALIRAGRLRMLPALACSVAAAFIADTVWFEQGRRSGRRVLQLVCRLSLEPDSCVRRTENTFAKYGMKALLISKFIPGLNAVAAPLAGASKRSFRQFAIFEIAGAFMWSWCCIGIGYLFSAQLEEIVAYAARTGSGLVLLLAASFALWIAWKYVQRRRFINQLVVARISPVELQERLDAGEDLFIVDLRGGLDEERDVIPGALRTSTEDLVRHHESIPRDREIVLVCS